MTEPRKPEPDREAQTRADRDPEVRPEVIQDLDVIGDDADNIAGGCDFNTATAGGVHFPDTKF
jgi:hypothetical protein